MTQKHTPTPWYINGFDLSQIISIQEGKDPDGRSYLDGRYQVPVANMQFHAFMDQQEVIANAKHIVKCVNAHDDLVAAASEANSLLKLLSFALLPEEVIKEIHRVGPRLGKALAKAKGDA